MCGGVCPGHPTCIRFARQALACESSAQVESALQLFEEMETVGLMPDTATFNALLRAHREAGDSEEALQVLDQMGGKALSPNAQTYHQAISACMSALKWERALELFDEMLEYAAGSPEGKARMRRSSLASQIGLRKIGHLHSVAEQRAAAGWRRDTRLQLKKQKKHIFFDKKNFFNLKNKRFELTNFDQNL